MASFSRHVKLRAMYTDPKHTLKLLHELENLGFDDEAFALVHHMGHRGQTIKRHRRYCEKTRKFVQGSSNTQVQRRLEFVFSAFKGGSLSVGSSELFCKLAEDARTKFPIREQK